jgi:putative transposase
VKPKEALRRWRCHLFGIPENESRQKDEASKGEMAAIYRDRIPREKALEVLARGGKLSQADYLRCKVRYFSDGAVIGGKAFVDEMFAAFRDRFGPKRKDGARPLRGLAGDSPDDRLFNLRQLRTGVFG